MEDRDLTDEIREYNEWSSSFNGWTHYRHDIINYFIDSYNYTDYLEIGVSHGETFEKIKAPNKTGVDPKPVEKGIALVKYKMKSNDFFNLIKPKWWRNEFKKYDIIFIDGLHFDFQVHADILNSLNHLNDNGVIICHDMNPVCEITQFKRSVVKQWNGDCWKAFAKLRTERDDLQMYVVDTDDGIGIIKKGSQQKFESNDSFVFNLIWQKYGSDFAFLDKHREELLNLISVDTFFETF